MKNAILITLVCAASVIAVSATGAHATPSSPRFTQEDVRLANERAKQQLGRLINNLNNPGTPSPTPPSPPPFTPRTPGWQECGPIPTPPPGGFPMGAASADSGAGKGGFGGQSHEVR